MGLGDGVVIADRTDDGGAALLERDLARLAGLLSSVVSPGTAAGPLKAAAEGRKGVGGAAWSPPGSDLGGGVGETRRAAAKLRAREERGEPRPL